MIRDSRIKLYRILMNKKYFEITENKILITIFQYNINILENNNDKKYYKNK
jgi:hypothetical protein